MSAAENKVFSVEQRADGIAVITINVPDESQNIIKIEFVEQANKVFDDLARDHQVKGIVFISGKPDSFIAGADIHMLAACENAEQVTKLARSGQAFCDRVAAFNKPVVAAIDGICLGGGLELALACHGRVCSDSDKTRLGLPEVQLGLLPGSGGTQRLPRLIGLMAAFDMMLTGRQLRAVQAKKRGLVDYVVPSTILLKAALKRISELKLSGKLSPPQYPKRLQWSLGKIPQLRRLFFDQVRKRTQAKTKGHYPSPERIIECVETGLQNGLTAGLSFEAQKFGELAMTPVARQLMHIYFATTELKKDNGLSDDVTAEPREIRKIGVLGAGLMGAGISYVSTSQSATAVRLKDKERAGLNRGLQYIHKLIQQRLQRRSITPYQAGQQQNRVTPTLDYSGFHDVDLVIEAVFEDIKLKQQMLKDIEEHTRDDTIFATNTSSIPIGKIAESAQNPGLLIGMHYFSPVEKMPLLEIIATADTEPEVITTAVAFGRKQGKTVIVVKDGAGFYVNRILAPYINEAGYLLESGVAIDAIDQALVKFGFPLGPFALLDEVGIDVGSKVAPILYDAFGERMKPGRSAETLLKDGRLGKKSKRGFYLYGQKIKKKKKPVDESVYKLLGITPTTSMDDEQICERCVFLMINEAARCLDEKVIRNVRDGDIGAIFGIGFPPFSGGPFRYADSIGIDNLVTKLQDYQRRLGERFAPAELLQQMASDGQTFYKDD